MQQIKAGRKIRVFLLFSGFFIDCVNCKWK